MFTDDDLKRLKELRSNAEASGWSMVEEAKFNQFFYDHLEALIARLEAAECLAEESKKECEEQARLLGMSGSREAKLLAELAAAKAEVATIQQRLSSPKS